MLLIGAFNIVSFLPIQIESAELRLIRLPLLHPFTIATGTMHDKIFPLLILRGGGQEGYAESVVDPVPDYLDETIPASMALLRDVFLPQIIGKSFKIAEDLTPILEPWRGHYMTKAVVEMAFWDLQAKCSGLSLQTLIGGSGTHVNVGVSLGINPIDETLKRILYHVELGYKRIKLKIMPGHDLVLLEAARSAFPDIPLSVDANSSYTLSDIDLLKELDRFALDYIEQPLTFDDLHDHAVLQSKIKTPLCLDESIRTFDHARKAIDTDATRIINIKVGRVGGIGVARKIHDLAAFHRIPVWCGGMLESGIGRAHNLHLSTLPNFTKPGDTSSSSRYFERDIVNEALEANDGRMAVPMGTGIGVTLDWHYLDRVTLSKDEFRL